MRLLSLLLATCPLLALAQAGPGLRFAAPVRYAVGREPHALAVGDVTGDGLPDVLTANYNKSRTTESNDYAMGAAALLPRRRAPGAKEVGSVSVLAGRADGSLAPRQDYPVGLYPDALALADLNRDGRLDVAVGCRLRQLVFSGGPVLTLLNQGAGRWQQVPVPADSSHYTSSADIALADLTGDGLPEVVTAEHSGNGAFLSTWVGRADTTRFAAPTHGYLGRGHYNPRRVLLADVTGDGRPDAVVANNADFRLDSALIVLPGRPEGRFGPPRSYPAVWGPVAVGDLNGDHYPDVVAVSAQARQVWLGSASGLGASQRTPQPGQPPLAALLADLNGDQRLDLITLHFTYDYPVRAPGSIVVRPGQAGSGFGPPVELPLGFGAGTRLAVADLNRDGRLDLLTLALDNTVLVLLNETR